MANFPVLPFRYLPGPLSIDQGLADHLQRCVLVVSDPPLQHDEYAIITVSADILDINKEAMLAEFCTILARDHGAPVTFPRVYPLGVGLVRFASPVVRDRMINTSPHTLDSDEEITFSVIRHDEGLNRRAPVFQHEAWVMFLMFPLDYQTTYYVNKAVSLFGKLLVWHNPRVNKVRVLVKVLIKDLRLVPFSLLMTQAGNFFGAEGGSWSIPVYILDGRDVAPEAVGNEEPVPPMNVTPHPDELPFLNDLQQHHLNLQIWNQQNADIAWEQEVGEPANQNPNGWGQWPVEAPVQPDEGFRGVSFRAMTGYEGPSMMDGIVPDHNTYDNPAAWSPESDFFSELEAAADNVVNGATAGVLAFPRAAGDSVAMEVDWVPASAEVMVGSSTLWSILLVDVAGFQFSVRNFIALVKFLGCKVYTSSPYLEYGIATDPLHCMIISLEDGGLQLGALFRDRLVLAVVLLRQSGQLPEDLALKSEIQSLLNTQNCSWAKALGGLRLDEEGNVFWATDDGLDMLTGADSDSFASSSSSLSQEAEMEAGAVVTGRRRGRPRKQDTPQVESQVKRSLRSNSQGYNHKMLPYLATKRKISKVKVASPPEVLQIAEMQHIGVEDCLIDPAALTVEKLMKQREDQE
ncbi:hypothetical protein ACQ4PT_039120 [Festuca glaucescens]